MSNWRVCQLCLFVCLSVFVVVVLGGGIFFLGGGGGGEEIH